MYKNFAIKILFLFGTISMPFKLLAQDCTPVQYQKLLKEADVAAQKGEYDLAINKLQSAKTCQPARAEEVDKKILAVFNEVNSQKKKAEQNAKEALRQKELAQKERDAAEKARKAEAEGRRVAELEARANANVTQALKITPIDPTKAFNHLQTALELTPYNLAAAEVRRNILQDNFFYGKRLSAHQGQVKHMKFALNGKVLFSAATDGRLIAWDTETWEHRVWQDQGGIEICAIDISTRYNLLLYAYTNGYITLRVLDSLNISQTIVTSRDLRFAAFVPNQRKLLLGCNDGWVRFWDLEKQVATDSIPVGKKKLMGASFLPSQGLLAVVTEADVQLWNPDTHVKVSEIKAADYFIAGITVPPDETSIYVNNGPFVTQYDLNGKSIVSFEKLPSAVASSTTDGDILITGILTGSVHIWNMQGNYLAALNSEPYNSQFSGIFSVAYEPESAILATSGADRTIRIWYLAKDRIAGFSADKFEATGVEYLHESKQMITTGMSGKIILSDMQGHELKHLSVFKTGISSSDADSSGSLICVSSRDSVAVIVFMDNTFIPKSKWKAHDHGSVTCVRLMPSGKEIMTANEDGWLKIWDINGVEKARYSIPKNVNDLSSSSDQKSIAVAAADSNAYLINRNTGKTITLKHKYPVMGVDFHPQKNALLTGSANVLRYWNLDSLESDPLRISIPNASIWSVRYALNGLHYAIGCWDGTARIFNRFGQETQVIRQHSGIVRYVRFSPDNDYLFSADNQGNVQLRLTMDAMLKQGRIYQFEDDGDNH